MKRLFGSRLKKRFLGLAGLVVVGLAVHFLDQQRPVAFELFSGLEQRTSAEPDYYTLNSRYYAYSAQGVRHHSISAQQLLHFSGQLITDQSTPSSDREMTLLTAPEIIRYGEQGQPVWHARAQTGQLVNGGDDFQLNQNVIVWKSDLTAADSEPWRRSSFSLFTEALTFNLPAGTVETDRPVQILMDSGETQSVGLHGDLNGNILYLKQVRSTLSALPVAND